MGELAKEWYQAGSLLVQAGFLLAGVWSVRAILKNMRASQEQMAALLKLTVSGGANTEDLRTGTRPAPFRRDGWQDAASTAGTVQRTRPPRTVWSGASAWLQAPIVSTGISPWRKAFRWLQAPAGS